MGVCITLGVIIDSPEREVRDKPEFNRSIHENSNLIEVFTKIPISLYYSPKSGIYLEISWIVVFFEAFDFYMCAYFQNQFEMREKLMSAALLGDLTIFESIETVFNICQDYYSTSLSCVNFIFIFHACWTWITLLQTGKLKCIFHTSFS